MPPLHPSDTGLSTTLQQRCDQVVICIMSQWLDSNFALYCERVYTCGGIVEYAALS